MQELGIHNKVTIFIKIKVILWFIYINLNTFVLGFVYISFSRSMFSLLPSLLLHLINASSTQFSFSKSNLIIINNCILLHSYLHGLSNTIEGDIGIALLCWLSQLQGQQTRMCTWILTKNADNGNHRLRLV